MHGQPTCHFIQILHKNFTKLSFVFFFFHKSQESDSFELLINNFADVNWWKWIYLFFNLIIILEPRKLCHNYMISLIHWHGHLYVHFLVPCLYALNWYTVYSVVVSKLLKVMSLNVHENQPCCNEIHENIDKYIIFNNLFSVLRLTTTTSLVLLQN